MKITKSFSPKREKEMKQFSTAMSAGSKVARGSKPSNNLLSSSLSKAGKAASNMSSKVSPKLKKTVQPKRKAIKAKSYLS